MIWGKYFIDGNVNPNYPTVTKDNWGVGVYPHISDNTGTYTSTTKDTMRLREPLDFMYVTTHTAERAYEKVLQYAGASLHRDEVDNLVVSDTRNGKATYTGKGSGDVYGIIDTPFDIKPIDADDDWNPWPILTSIAAPKDTDGDGMPDEWELANGLNPNDKDYLLTFRTGSKMEAELKMTLTHANGNIVLSKNVVIENTNNWTPSVQHNYVLEQLQTGTYTLKFTVTKTTGNYAGNWGDLAFYTLNDIETIPGKLDLSKGNYGGGVVNEGANVGYIKDGGVATYSFKNTQEGVYSLAWEVARYGTGGNIDIIVKNAETEEIEAQTTYTLQSDAPSTYVPITRL